MQAGESASAFADRCGRFADLGIDHVTVLAPTGPWNPDQVEVLAEASHQLA
ncbi:hypothetical protein [Microbacterium sp.]|uniref:hypothetical protein n=1 Tax=Microbacterium sp. TaxID=51671 RepID=UPI002D76D03E|nr:hypothetical protein [Microbacterium sp.]HET6300551.1 hypothetical protein [Microbacterium sp.]